MENVVPEMPTAHRAVHPEVGRLDMSVVDPPSLHPRIAVSGLCLPLLSAVDAVAEIAALGVGQTSITAARLRESGPEEVLGACQLNNVAVITTTGSIQLSRSADLDELHDRARADIDQAATVGAASLYTLTGPRVGADWAGSVDAYVEFVGPLVDYAVGKSLALAVEPTNWLYADVNFVHSFHDALLLASRAGLGVCLDLFHVWTESGLREDIAKNLPLISNVQLSDMTAGARSLPCRTVPGEGAMPIEALLHWLLDAGYEGMFEVELGGPRSDEIGHQQATAQAVAWLNAVLLKLGA